MSRKSLFSTINHKKATAVSTDVIFQTMNSAIQNQKMSAKANLYGLENLDDVSQFNPDQSQAYETFKDISAGLESATADVIGGIHKVDEVFGCEAISAAAIALIQANSASNGQIQQHVAPKVGKNSINYPSQFSSKGDFAAIAGNERFDMNIVSQYRTSTAALQLATMNQAGYISLAYPTLLLGPTDYGYTLTVPRGTIQDRAHLRNSDASPKDIRKLSVLAQYRSVGDTVTHANTLYPVVRPANDKWLVTYGRRVVTDFQGNTQTTAPVKVGVTCDYIRLTLPDGYTEFGPTAGTPSLAPGGSLTELYLNLDGANDVILLDTKNMPGTSFVFENTSGFEANSERLNFESTFKFDESNIKGLDGVTESATLRSLIEPGQTIYIVVKLNAEVMLENGNISSSAAKPRIDRIVGANGEDVPRDRWNAAQQGFDLLPVTVESAFYDHRRSNSNLEIFGDIVHVDNVLVHFESTINHPVSILTSVAAPDSPELLTMLTQAVKLNNHRMATVALLNAQNHIENLARGGFADPVRVQGAPAGALCYTPAFIKDTFDIEDGLNNEKSGELLNDISGALRAKIKDMVSNLMRDSMYVQAVQSAYVVGEKQKGVKIGIITSQYIADFLQIQGDNRLLGDEYDYQIEVNPAAPFDNRIMVFPTTVDNGKTDLSPLQFGVGLYCPDVVYHANATYANQHVKEVRVMNRFTPHTLGAVMGVLDVKGITKAVSKRVRRDVHMLP